LRVTLLLQTKISGGSVTPGKLNGGQSGSAPIFGVRAWGVITNGKSNNPNLNGGNVSSVNKVSNGEFNVSFSVNMPNSNYAVVASLGSDQDHVVEISNRTTSGFKMICSDPGTGNNNKSDTDIVQFMVIC
jgi:hypothetical protein